MGFFGKIKAALVKTKDGISNKLAAIFSKNKIGDEFYEDLEDLLISSDVSVSTSVEIVEELKENAIKDRCKDKDFVVKELKRELKETLDFADRREIKFPVAVMVVGVNGVGKTTTIGKLAHKFVKMGKSVTIAAGDTFRAAAAEQLSVWADRAKVRIIKSQEGADAAAVVYDAAVSAKAKKTDVLIIDTAGRLHVKSGLMEELKKMNRVLEKEYDITKPRQRRRRELCLANLRDARRGNALPHYEGVYHADHLDTVTDTQPIVADMHRLRHFRHRARHVHSDSVWVALVHKDCSVIDKGVRKRNDASNDARRLEAYCDAVYRHDLRDCRRPRLDLELHKVARRRKEGILVDRLDNELVLANAHERRDVANVGRRRQGADAPVVQQDLERTTGASEVDSVPRSWAVVHLKLGRHGMHSAILGAVHSKHNRPSVTAVGVFRLNLKRISQSHRESGGHGKSQCKNCRAELHADILPYPRG